MTLERVDTRALPDRDEVRAFLVVRNEAERLPWTLAHHRRLGVSRFLVVDNGSTDGTQDYLLGEPDVHVFRTGAAYQDASNGMGWIDMLLHFYGSGRWCLLLDADEFLVYPGCESIGLSSFCRTLEEHGLNGLATMFIDVYAEGPIASTDLCDGRPPLEVCRYFDATGYFHFPVAGSCIPRVYGGPRARVFWPEIGLRDHARRVPSYADRAFDEDAYLDTHPDVAAAVQAGRFQSGFEHFVRYGHAERRAVTLRHVEDWPEDLYLQLYADVRASVEHGVFASGLDHFVRHGQFEGRLLWTDGPPCLSQVPLVRWTRGMRLAIGRHAVHGCDWRWRDRVGGALLHVKLTADLVRRGETTADSPSATAWALENARYRAVLDHQPAVSALCESSQAYRGSAQLVEAGLVTPLAGLPE